MKNGVIIKAFEPTGDDMAKINRFSCRELTADELYVFKVDLCNNDIDRDFECFSVSALNTLAEEFIGKTGIRDHKMSAENQMARIFDTEVIKIDGRKTKHGSDFYTLRAKAYMLKISENENIISEIDAGIKKEVSVSCSAGRGVCSVCGKDRRKGNCGHINGKSYDGKLCYTTLDDITDAYEFSFVAVPAQKEAGVVKAFGIEKGEVDMENIRKQLDFDGDSIVLSKQQAAAISSFIDETEENARLGTQYKQNLVKSLVGLCERAVPEMNMKIFEGVASIMTAKELLEFKTAFEKNIASKNKPSPQLARTDGAKKSNNNEFMI